MNGQVIVATRVCAARSVPAYPRSTPNGRFAAPAAYAAAMPACECSSSSSGAGQPCSTASRSRCSEPTPGLPPQREHELPRAAHPDQLVVDDVGRHPHERQVAPPLPDQLVAGGVRDQVREALERDGVSVVHELAHRFGERDGLGHRLRTGTDGRAALHGDPAELGELVDHRLAAEPPPARVLDAAERHLRLVADGLVVDVDDPGLELLREREAAVGVRRDDPGAEAVARRVRARDRLVGAVDDLDREHRAERLVLREVGVLRDVGDQRRLEARARRPRRRRAPWRPSATASCDALLHRSASAPSLISGPMIVSCSFGSPALSVFVFSASRA